LAVVLALIMLSGCDSRGADAGALAGKWQHSRAATCDPRRPILTFDADGIYLISSGSSTLLLDRYDATPIKSSTPGAAPLTRISFAHPDLRGNGGELVPTHVAVEHLNDVIIARAVAQGRTPLSESQAEKLLIFLTRQRCRKDPRRGNLRPTERSCGYQHFTSPRHDGRMKDILIYTAGFIASCFLFAVYDRERLGQPYAIRTSLVRGFVVTALLVASVRWPEWFS